MDFILILATISLGGLTVWLWRFSKSQTASLYFETSDTDKSQITLLPMPSVLSMRFRTSIKLLYEKISFFYSCIYRYFHGTPFEITTQTDSIGRTIYNYIEKKYYRIVNVILI
jgi:hypothetical protein